MQKVKDSQPVNTAVTPTELEEFRALKPYICQCLSLNHDLNNPLAGIIGYAEFLQLDSDNLTDNQKRFISQILTCALRMQELIQQLCQEKIELSRQIDLKSVMDKYVHKMEKSD